MEYVPLNPDEQDAFYTIAKNEAARDGKAMRLWLRADRQPTDDEIGQTVDELSDIYHLDPADALRAVLRARSELEDIAARDQSHGPSS